MASRAPIAVVGLLCSILCGCTPDPIGSRGLLLVTDSFLAELGVPPSVGITYSPATIEAATGRRFGDFRSVRV